MHIRSNCSEKALLVFHAMNNRDFSELEKVVTPDVVFDFPGAGRIEGSRRVLLFLKALLRKYPELEFTVSEIIDDGSRVVVVWTNKGRHLDDTPYSNSGITLIHFTDDRISFISDYFKDTSFVK